RVTIGRTGDRHHAAHRLHQRVVAGQLCPAFRAETTDRAVDQARIGHGEFLVAETEPFHGSRPEVLDQYVRSPGQLPGQFEIVRVLEVQLDRTLVAVDREEEGRPAFGVDRWRPGAGVVAAR